MNIIMGDIALLKEDITLLHKQLNNAKKNEDNILSSLVNQIYLHDVITESKQIPIENKWLLRLRKVCKSKNKKQLMQFIKQAEVHNKFTKMMIDCYYHKIDQIIRGKLYTELPEEEEITIIKDFVSKELPEYYKLFIDALAKQRLFRTKSTKYQGLRATFLNSITNNHNILVNDNMSVLFMGNVVHEFGHVIEGVLLHNNIFDKNTCSEIISCKYERKFYSFLLENQLLTDEVYTVLAQYYDNNLDYLLTLEYLSNLSPKLLEQQIKDPRYCIDKTLPYAYGMTIANYLEALRNNDLDKYNYLFKRIDTNRLQNSRNNITDIMDVLDNDIPSMIDKDINHIIEGSKKAAVLKKN